MEEPESLCVAILRILAEHHVAFVNFQRGSARFVYAHMVSGFVASRLIGCYPRGGKPVMAVPPCAIIVSTEGANSSGDRPRFAIRWATVTPVPDGAKLTSISFCSLVDGSTPRAP